MAAHGHGPLISILFLGIFCAGFSVEPELSVSPVLSNALTLTPPHLDLPPPLPAGKKGQASHHSVAWGYFHPAWLLTSRENTFWKREIYHLMNDPSDRLEKEFRITDALQKRVAFWIAIYSRFSSDVRVFHDRDDLGLVFGYVDFSSLHHYTRSPAIRQIWMRQLEKMIHDELEACLKEVAGLAPRRILSVRELRTIKAFLNDFGGSGSLNLRQKMQALRTQTGQADFFRLALQRSQSFLPEIETAFKEQGIPVGLSRIPFVESSFNVKAKSKVGALGIWQFMPKTAKAFIGKRNKGEWGNPVSQTAGAARLLSSYRRVMPDWGSTVISYNSGVGRVSKLLKRHNLGRGEDLLASKYVGKGLGFAGKNFLAELLAANLIITYRTEVFARGLLPNPLVQNEELTLPSGELACFSPHI